MKSSKTAVRASTAHGTAAAATATSMEIFISSTFEFEALGLDIAGAFYTEAGATSMF
ncbi:hypothetical protein [Novosphingobium sp. 9U]|uniref:hypothetical protein n=1 Tax=Novosphingobium sp. 9U TaxID=2653158 RepID=UPI001358450D|nr:hypothetical protein [Novosphingobium sp. 9U]